MNLRTILTWSILAASAAAGDVFSYPPSAGGGLCTSAWVAPDGTDSDTYAWNDFVLPTTEGITEVRWRGGYGYGAPFGKATQFTISFFATNITGFEPLIVTLPDPYGEPCLANYQVAGNAGETPAGVVGGVAMYDYHAFLPTPFVATAGVKYWIRIVAWQPGYPDWGLIKGTGGNGSHFRYITGLHMFQNVPGDPSFTLATPWKDLGFAKAGSKGLPTLVGTGALKAGQSGTLKLTNAKTNATAFWIVGATSLNAPLYSGTLVPSPNIVFGVPTNGSGQTTLPFALPANAPSAVSFYLQCWIPDAAATQGYAASNALKGTTD